MKTFLSIGTGPGMGIATAARFASEGFHTVVASRNTDNLGALAGRALPAGSSHEVQRVDATDAGSVRDLVSQVIDRRGAIDVLHYNAASLRQATILDQPAETFLSDLSINVANAMLAIQAVAPSMFKRGEGTILLTGGGFGVKPNPNFVSLGIGKAAIHNLVHSLFESFKAKGVHIGFVNVAAIVEPDTEAAAAVGEAFWQMHAAQPSDWTPETLYTNDSWRAALGSDF